MSFGSHRKMSFVRFILCATVLSVLAMAANAQQSKAPWSYRGEDNPANWGKTRRRVRHMLCWQKPVSH
jgi:carbonic anhydrase